MSRVITEPPSAMLFAPTRTGERMQWPTRQTSCSLCIASQAWIEKGFSSWARSTWCTAAWRKVASKAISVGRSSPRARSQYSCGAFAGALLNSGRGGEARQIAAEAAAMPNTIGGTYNLACFWAQAGDPERALEYLRWTNDNGWAIAWLADDPDLASLHGDPEFEAIVADIRRRIGRKGDVAR